MNKKINYIEFKSFCCNEIIHWSRQIDFNDYRCYCDVESTRCIMSRLFEHSITVKNFYINNQVYDLYYDLINYKIILKTLKRVKVLEFDFDESLINKELITKKIRNNLNLR